MREEERDREGVPVGASIWVFASLAGFTAALTVASLGMRSVMEIGACAEGGPFVPVRPCPQGVPVLMVGGIWLGLACSAIYVWQSFRNGVPSLAGLLWPALFLSFGWNFLEFGLDPPRGGGVEWGWLVCAVFFFAMGGIPLLAALPALKRRFTGTAQPSGLRALLLPRRVRPAAPGVSTSPEPEDSSVDLVEALERLDALRRSGALDELEYDAAKRKILGSGGP